MPFYDEFILSKTKVKIIHKMNITVRSTNGRPCETDERTPLYNQMELL
mgnify:CR=1 FL=1